MVFLQLFAFPKFISTICSQDKVFSHFLYKGGFNMEQFNHNIGMNMFKFLRNKSLNRF